MARWIVWIVFVLTWTVALIAPVPPTEKLPAGEFLTANQLLVAKSTHIGMYTLMTFLSGWVGVPARYRALMMFFLMLHATGTELLQLWLGPYSHRTGSLGDVGFDLIGIALGLALNWKGWTRKPQDERSDSWGL